MRISTCFLASLAAPAQAEKTARTHAVLHFTGDKPLTEGRIDPVNTPGQTSGHVHTVMGSSNIGISATGQDLIKSRCSNSIVEGDFSGYWVPKLYFRDSSGTIEPVDMLYFNAYYFFEPTDDTIVAFPLGLMIHSGDISARRCVNAGGQTQLDGGSNSTIQPSQWVCPRSSYQPPSWPSAAESDGSTEGIQDPKDQQAGQGFPDANCDGFASPLRQDVHLPSCYDPSKDLTDHAHNMVFPTTGSDFKQNCPSGFVHVPHLFIETYWNTPAFASRWTPFQGQQPFVLSNGDASGCSAHADFLAAWDTNVLQNVIDTCNTAEDGMGLCSGVTSQSKSDNCTIESPIKEEIYGNLTALPGNNPIVGWGKTGGSGSNGHPKRAAQRSAAVSARAPEPLLGVVILGFAYNVLRSAV